MELSDKICVKFLLSFLFKQLADVLCVCVLTGFLLLKQRPRKEHQLSLFKPVKVISHHLRQSDSGAQSRPQLPIHPANLIFCRRPASSVETSERIFWTPKRGKRLDDTLMTCESITNDRLLAAATSNIDSDMLRKLTFNMDFVAQEVKYQRVCLTTSASAPTV